MSAAGRLFFALLPPPDVQAELGRLAVWCQRRCGGFAMAPENIHLTLLFLGELVPGQVDVARRAAAGLRCESFGVNLDRIEFWPGPRLLCAVPDQPLPAATALSAALREAVRGVVTLPPRPFAAHVTLLRRLRRLDEVSMLPLAWPVTEFCLLRSQQLARGVRYSSIDAWPCA